MGQVTYRYYIGLIAFLNEEYPQASGDLKALSNDVAYVSSQAEKEMEFAFNDCYLPSYRNQE